MVMGINKDTVTGDNSVKAFFKNLSTSDVFPTPLLPSKINFRLIISGSGTADYITYNLIVSIRTYIVVTSCIDTQKKEHDTVILKLFTV